MGFALPLSEQQVRDFCTAHGIRRLLLFGSSLRSDFSPTSDVDLLVEFEPDAEVTYLDLVRLELELTRLIGRTVDLRTPAELSPRFRDDVLATAEVQYAA